MLKRIKSKFNKKGSEFVEGAMVLPIIILIIVSLIGALIFCYESLEKQCDLHSQLIEMAEQNESIFKVVEENIESSSYIKGFVKVKLREPLNDCIFAFCRADIIRLGDFIYDIE